MKYTSGGLQLCYKERFLYKGFAANFEKFLRATFSQKTSGRQLLINLSILEMWQLKKHELFAEVGRNKKYRGELLFPQTLRHKVCLINFQTLRNYSKNRNLK